jgi:ketosteroid isomerase-like protein
MILNRRAYSMKILSTFMQLALLLGSCAIRMEPAQAAEDADKSVTGLVQRFTAAQSAMDVGTLASLTAEDYIEISPLGEVDPRAKMLTFYVKDDKHVLPAMAVDDMTTRVLGDAAVVIAKISYSLVNEGQSRTFSLRSTFVAEKVGGVWKLVSGHYTPIRPPMNPG